jgi:AcrR family transcriptional regulator
VGAIDTAGTRPDVNAKVAKLPRGRHNIPRQKVTENQRQRMFDAVAATVAEEGYLSLSVRQVIVRAGVSRTTFYEQFKDKHECVTAAYEAALERATATILDAAAASPDWASSVAAGVDAALELATEAPDQARLLIVFHAAVAEPRLSRRALEAQRQLIGLLRAGRQGRNGVREPLELTEQAILGAAMSVVGAQILADRVDRLPELKPELVQLILTPYIGGEAAAAVALAA